MKIRKINFDIQEFASSNELSDIEQKLVKVAFSAKTKAYAPYSGFKVGAAVLFDDNTIIEGSNQENAAFPSGLCAERVAIYYANSQFPDKKIKMIAITGGIDNEININPISPCGACRQVFIESESRQKSAIEILLIGKDKILKISELKHLLPLHFIGEDLSNKLT